MQGQSKAILLMRQLIEYYVMRKRDLNMLEKRILLNYMEFIKYMFG